MGRIKGWYPDAHTVYERHAQILVGVDRLAAAEELLERAALRNYREMVELSVSHALAEAGFNHLVSALRCLVDIKRRLGKEAEVRALEQDLDETDAILPSMSAAALNELRDEMRGETQRAGPGSAGAAGQKKKKLTRKQQKRKAAQRRKAEARAAAAAEAAAAVAGGGVDGGGGEGKAEAAEE